MGRSSVARSSYHRRVLKTLVTVLAVAAPSLARAEGFESSAPSLEVVLEQAKKADKPVLLDFSTVW